MTLATPVFPPAVLSFGFADATSGRGLQADMLTLASLGCHPLAVTCAVAVCDTRGVDDFVPLDTELVVSQARAVLEDVPVSAIRLGMTGHVSTLVAVAEILSDYPDARLVVEPELGHFDHDDDSTEDYLDALADLVVPHAEVVVCGLSGLMRLAAGASAADEDAVMTKHDAAQMLIAEDATHVLLTDGGEPGPTVINELIGASGVVRRDEWPRLAGHYLGARATLAAALAGHLAHGAALGEAAREAQEFTWQALAAAYRPGMGLHLPDRFFWNQQGVRV